MEKGSGVLLYSALEQLGTNFEQFLEYILENKPRIVVHIDFLEELYDPKDEFDNMVLKFAKKRNYLSGYVRKMRRWEREGKIEMVKMKRVPFGQLYIDYSYDIWKPV